MDWHKRQIINTTDYRVFQVNTTEFTYQAQSAEFYQITAPNWVNIIAIHNDCIVKGVAEYCKDNGNVV